MFLYWLCIVYLFLDTGCYLCISILNCDQFLILSAIWWMMDLCISLQRKPKAECEFQIIMTAWYLLHPQGSDLRRGEGKGKKCVKKSFEVPYVCLRAKIFELRVRHLNPRLPAYHIHKHTQFQWADLLWILKPRQGFIRFQNKGTLLFTHIYLIALGGSFARWWL